MRPPGAISFFSRFYRHSLFGTTSGGHIFLCVKKDMEERHAKGLQSRPLESGFYTGVGGETCVSPTNSHWCNLRDLGPPVACGKHTVSTDSIVLLVVRCIRNTYRITNLICSRKSGGCGSAGFSTRLVGAIINRPRARMCGVQLVRRFDYVSPVIASQ